MLHHFSSNTFFPYFLNSVYFRLIFCRYSISKLCDECLTQHIQFIQARKRFCFLTQREHGK